MRASGYYSLLHEKLILLSVQWLSNTNSLDFFRSSIMDIYHFKAIVISSKQVCEGDFHYLHHLEQQDQVCSYLEHG